MDREVVFSLGVALAVGLLVGLERQMAIARKEGKEILLGGVRTFPLIAMMGAVSTLLARSMGAWVAGASLVGFVTVVALYRIAQRQEDREGGLTTEVAAIVTWLLGALAVSEAIAEVSSRR